MMFVRLVAYPIKRAYVACVHTTFSHDIPTKRPRLPHTIGGQSKPAPPSRFVSSQCSHRHRNSTFLCSCHSSLRLSFESRHKRSPSTHGKIESRAASRRPPASCLAAVSWRKKSLCHLHNRPWSSPASSVIASILRRLNTMRRSSPCYVTSLCVRRRLRRARLSVDRCVTAAPLPLRGYLWRAACLQPSHCCLPQLCRRRRLFRWTPYSRLRSRRC